MDSIQALLLAKNYILSDNQETDREKASYYNAYILTNYGIELTNPSFISKEVLEILSEFFGDSRPKSFYNNPQDTKFFNCDELFIEQIVSYITIQMSGTHDENTNFKRIELFKKALPKYVKGDDLVLRKFTIINKEEANKVCSEVMKSLCSYTRPFSEFESNQFLELYKNGFYNNEDIMCKDNIFIILPYRISLAAKLDCKDLVKYSLKEVGVHSKNLTTYFEKNPKALSVIKEAISLVKMTKMSKRQAKQFNKLCDICGIKMKLDNSNSPYRLAELEMEKGNVLGAANVFYQNGSLFERNLKYLLSRASKEETLKIIDMIPSKNPLVLLQLIGGICDDEVGKPRVFSFINRKRTLCSHIETEYETKWRKSCLSNETRDLLNSIVQEKIKNYYHQLPSLGSIYISSEFKKVALPFNNSASGNGIDVLPCGSRITINGDYIRTFVHWENVFDIDSSTIFLKEDSSKPIGYEGDVLGFFNYASKPFGDDALHSGDCRDETGSEYQDYCISELRKRGYKYAIFAINGYGGDFSKDGIKCGCQVKSDLNTDVSDSKNILFQMNVKGDANAFTGFAVDFDTKEIVILNLILSDPSAVVSSNQFTAIKKYLSKIYLDKQNMYSILQYRGEIVEDIKSADYVFDREYQGNDNQVVIRPYEVEKLVELINEKFKNK